MSSKTFKKMIGIVKACSSASLKTVAILFIVLIVAAAYAVEWIATCGLIKLVTLCFGWTFSWPIATGIWLIMHLAKAVFGGKSK